MVYKICAGRPGMHILVTGASGSGTTTLGRALAAERGMAFVDSDDLYWLPTTPPFTTKRDSQERCALLREKLSTPCGVVVAGSIMGWDEESEHDFSLIVFLQAPAEVRVERLRQRELKYFGLIDEVFLNWAAQYDTGTTEGRNLARHQAWLETKRCPVLCLSGLLPVEELLQAIRKAEAEMK
jgi:uridine kinase